MNIVTMGFRNTFRNVVRTISIVSILGLSIGLCMVMLIANQTFNKQIKSVRESIGNNINIIPAGFFAGSVTNTGLSSDQLDKVEKLPHVTKFSQSFSSILQTESDKKSQIFSMTSTNGDDSQPLGMTSLKSPTDLKNADTSGGVVIGGGSNGKVPDDFALPVQITGTTTPTFNLPPTDTGITVTSGKVIDGKKDTDEALVSESMAAKNNLKVGSTFTAYSETIKVVGIFKSDISATDATVVMSLPAVQRLSKNPKAITTAKATVDSVDNIDSVTNVVKNILGKSADVTNTKSSIEDVIKPLNNIASVSLYSLWGALGASAVIILLGMIMIVRERKHEIGVLKAIGSSNIRVMAQFMIEAFTLTLFSLIIGLAIGIASSNVITSALSSSSSSTPGLQTPVGTSVVFSFQSPVQTVNDIKATVGLDTLLLGLGVAFAIALFGSAVSALFIAKVKPAEVLRSE